MNKDLKELKEKYEETGMPQQRPSSSGMKRYPKRLKCCICQKTTEDWVVAFRYIILGSEVVGRRIEFCRRCYDDLEEKLKWAEVAVVSGFLANRNIDLTKLPE